MLVRVRFLIRFVPILSDVNVAGNYASSEYRHLGGTLWTSDRWKMGIMGKGHYGVHGGNGGKGIHAIVGGHYGVSNGAIPTFFRRLVIHLHQPVGKMVLPCVPTVCG